MGPWLGEAAGALNDSFYKGYEQERQRQRQALEDTRTDAEYDYLTNRRETTDAQADALYEQNSQKNQQALELGQYQISDAARTNAFNEFADPYQRKAVTRADTSEQIDFNIKQMQAEQTRFEHETWRQIQQFQRNGQVEDARRAAFEADLRDDSILYNMIMDGQLRQAAMWANNSSMKGVDGATTFVIENGPEGRQYRLVDANGQTVTDSQMGGAPVILSEEGIRKGMAQANSYFKDTKKGRGPWYGAGNGAIYNADTGEGRVLSTGGDSGGASIYFEGDTFREPVTDEAGNPLQPGYSAEVTDSNTGEQYEVQIQPDGTARVVRVIGE